MLFHHILSAYKIALVVFFVFLLVFIGQVKADTPAYQLAKEAQPVERYLSRLINEPSQKSFAEINDLTSSDWQATQLQDGTITIKPGQNWFAFKLVNNSENAKQAILDIAHQMGMTDYQLYVMSEAQSVTEKTLTIQRSNNRSFSLAIAPHSQVTLFLSIESTAQNRSSFKLYSDHAYFTASSALQFQQGLAIGGLFCFSLMFVLVFFATEKKAALMLFGHLVCHTLMLAVMLGVNLFYFMPQFPALQGIEIPLLAAVSALCLLVFTTQLFNLKADANPVYRMVRIGFWLLILTMPLSVQFASFDNINWSLAIYALVMFCLVVIGFYLHKRATRRAFTFTVVMIFQLIFVGVIFAGNTGVDFGYITNRHIFYSVFFSLNFLGLSFVLSRQYRSYLRDKQRSHRRALQRAIKSERQQEALLSLQTQNQEALEYRVQERTLELNIALQELEEANNELLQKNTLDALTGLYNRRFYDQKILAEYRRSKRNLTPLSLILIDIDHFKEVNDTHGHLAGDYCLKWLSKQLKPNMKRSSDMAFRYGGEEFCLLLPDTDSAGAKVLAEKLRIMIAEQTCMYKKISIPLTVSIGVFTYIQQDNVLPEHLFSGADKALYQAKGHGRNQTIVCKDPFAQ